MTRKDGCSIGLIWMLTVLTPTAAAQDWPLMEPELASADGYRQAAWTEYQWRDEAWSLARRQRLAYDEQGHLVQITHQSRRGDDWRTSRQETFTYDAAGRRTEKLIQESIGQHLHNRGRHTYRYDGEQLVEEVIDGWSYEQTWTPLFRHTYHYDAAGRLLLHDVVSLQKELAFGAERMQHTYDDAGRIVQQIRLREQDGAWKEAEKRTYRYGGGHLAELSSFYLTKGGPGWAEAIRLLYRYDGDRLSSIVTQHRGPTDGLDDALRRDVAYDDAGNPMEVLYRMRRGDQWHHARKETYTYEVAPKVDQ